MVKSVAIIINYNHTLGPYNWSKSFAFNFLEKIKAIIIHLKSLQYFLIDNNLLEICSSFLQTGQFFLHLLQPADFKPTHLAPEFHG